MNASHSGANFWGVYRPVRPPNCATPPYKCCDGYYSINNRQCARGNFRNRIFNIFAAAWLQYNRNAFFHRVPGDLGYEAVDVGGSVGSVVQEVGVFVHIEDDEGVGEGYLPEVVAVEEDVVAGAGALFVGEDAPAAGGFGGGDEVVLPAFGAAEVFVHDELGLFAYGGGGFAQVFKVEFVEDYAV